MAWRRQHRRQDRKIHAQLGRPGEIRRRVTGGGDEQLRREPLPLPTLAIKRKPPSIFEYEYEDFEILNYEAHPHIKAAVAV